MREQNDHRLERALRALTASLAATGASWDAIALLTLYPEIDLQRVRARVRELAAAAEVPELARGLETVIAAVRPQRSSAPARRTANAIKQRPKRKRAAPQTTKKRPSASRSQVRKSKPMRRRGTT